MSTGSPLPDKFPHIFFEVAFQVLPELSYDDLVYLSELVRTQQPEPVYGSLADAVRKVQWMKLWSTDATDLDGVLVAQYDGSVDVVLNDPVGQIRHAKALLAELLRHSNPVITLDAYARSTTPAKIEAQGWVMQQLLTESSKAALANAKPASTRTM